MELKWHELVTAQYVLVTALVALVAAWLVKHLMTSPKNLPPGPSGLPLLGVFTKFIGMSGDPLPLLSEWADRYGEITSFYFGPQLVVSLNSYGAVAEAFRHPNLQGRPRSRMLEEISGFGPNAGLLIGVGDIWKEQRKFTFSVFRSLGVGKRSYEDTVAAEMTQLARAIEEKEGSPFDPSDLLSRAVSNVICTIIFGTQYKYDDAEFKELLHILNTNMRLGGSGGWIFFLPIPGLSKIPFGAINTMMVNARRFYAFIDAHIYAHRKHGIPEIPRDFIDQYLIKLEEIEGTESSFNQKSLKSVISDLFFAGTETTLTTLKWCILYMIAYPEIQSRVQSEIDTVIGRDRLPGLSDRKDLPYTCAVLTEVQRKAAVVSLGVPHMAEADVTIKDFTIPKGTIVLSNLWKVLNSNAFWEEADDFKPERFLDENGKLTKREDLIFFSTGRRICLGEQLARMETFLGFTSLLHRFTFKQPDNATAPSFEGVLGGTRVSLPYVTCAIPRN
ncbi:cytochrome P450 2J4-like [Lytechinus pictus]|uniref:cytochrome P450 2J4-like n=1 Tax=Lytechinus pictus TaxID=7653 RepID=UPI0030B9C9EE